MPQPSNRELAGAMDWCIAGGYAACPQLASDMDVWILGYNKDILDSIRTGMLLLHPEIVPEENASREDADPSIYFGMYYTLKVGHMPACRDWPQRHILVTTAPDIQSLIGAFDISTHACATDANGRFIAAPGFTSIWEVPKILLVGGAATQERYSKIHARYAHFREGLNGAELEIASV